MRKTLFQTIAIGGHNLQQEKAIVLNSEYSKDIWEFTTANRQAE